MKGKINLHILTIGILSIINISVVIGLWITGFLSGLNPEKWGWLSLVGYAFPVFIIATILFMPVWIFFRKRYMLISFIGLIVVYYPVTLYCPVNINFDVSDGERLLKVMSYNVCNWGVGYDDNDITIDENLTDEEKYNVMVDYFKSVNADIVSIQEGTLKGSLDSLRSIYHYVDTVNVAGGNNCAVMLLSKYPITRKENFNFNSTGNGAGAFWVKVYDKEVIVISTHLQSMGFSVDEKEKFSTMVHGYGSDSVESTSKSIFGKILSATKIRASQAQMIARFIEKHHSYNSDDLNYLNFSNPIIVMGDFNDIPQSYTHALISDHLYDCYREAGSGPGYSYKHFGMSVRIDNILCSKDFTPISCKVDKNIDLSDHLPIISVLKIKK